jgi:hypothetical protein
MLENKTVDGSYVHNCIIERRRDDTSDSLFEISTDGSKMITTLNGYAIIPRYKYENLILAQH